MEARATMEGRGPRAAFMAFGTKGDVLPIAALAASLASDQQHYRVMLITHLAHQSLSGHLAAKGVSYIPISSPPVLSAHRDGFSSDSEYLPFSSHKKIIEKEHRRECLSAIGRVFGDSPTMEGDFIVINFFALEGWNLAELFHVRCIIAAPYVVPYSAPSSFERRFKQELPRLYKYLQDAPANMVCWKDVAHWMWPLFTEHWGSWRSDCLNLSPYPFTDPVTNLPMWHLRAQSPLLLYGFSKEIVEFPDYWPSNVLVCGFWFPPMVWQFSCSKCIDMSSVSQDRTQKDELCENHADLQHFLMETSSPCSPIFIGLSSIGSMGFLRNPRAFLLVLKAVLEFTDYNFILFTAGYEPLDDAIRSFAGSSLNPNKLQHFTRSEDCALLFSDRIFCFSGIIPYSWLFPRCSVAIHHGGSGSTAAALHAGIPQILCPFVLDQFYWAERLFWLGIAPEPLQRQHLVPDNDDMKSIEQAANALIKALKLAQSAGMKAQALRIAKRISLEHPCRSLNWYKHVMNVVYCLPISYEGPRFPPEAAKAKEAAWSTTEYYDIMEGTLTALDRRSTTEYYDIMEGTL